MSRLPARCINCNEKVELRLPDPEAGYGYAWCEPGTWNAHVCPERVTK